MKPSSFAMMVWSCVLGSRNVGKRMDLPGPFWPFGGSGSGHPGHSLDHKASITLMAVPQVGRCRAPRGALNSLQDTRNGGEFGRHLSAPTEWRLMFHHLKGRNRPCLRHKVEPSWILFTCEPSWPPNRVVNAFCHLSKPWQNMKTCILREKKSPSW